MRATDLAAGRQLTIRGLRLRQPATMAGLVLGIVALLLLYVALSGGGRDLAPWTAFRLAMLGLLALALLAGRLRRTALSSPMAAVLIAVAVTSIGSVRPQSSVDQVITWSTYAAVLLVVASMISSVQSARRFVDAAVFVGGALSLIGLFLYWGAGNPMMRWYSTFYWPNPFAGFLLLVLPVEALRCLLAESRREAVSHGAMTMLLGIPFILTFSRGAWVAGALMAGLAAIVLRTALHRRAAARAVALLLAMGAAAFILTGGQAFRSPTAGVLTRATSTADLNEYSLLGRLNFWRGALEIFRDHPIGGTGPGTYAYVYPQYQRDVRFYAQDPHNLFVQMAADSGIVGLSALLWLMISFVALGSRIVRAARGTPEFPWIAGVVFGIGAFWVHTGVEMNWSFPAGPAMAFALMGVLAGYDSLTAAAARSEPSSPVGRILTATVIVLLMVLTGLQYRAAAEFRAGRAAYAAGQWQAAAARFQRASALNPIDPRYPSALADARFKTGEPLSAVLPLVRRAQSLNRTHPTYWYQLALLAGQESTPEAIRETEDALRMVIVLDPFHYPQAYRRLAALYRRQGDPTKALEVYTRAAVRYPDTVAQDFVLRPRLWPGILPLFMDWAELLTEQGQYEEAEAVYARIVRLEPKFVPAYVQLAQLYLETGRVPDAIRVVEAGLRTMPDDRQLRELHRKTRAMRR